MSPRSRAATPGVFPHAQELAQQMVSLRYAHMFRTVSFAADYSVPDLNNFCRPPFFSAGAETHHGTDRPAPAQLYRITALFCCVKRRRRFQNARDPARVGRVAWRSEELSPTADRVIGKGVKSYPPPLRAVSLGASHLNKITPKHLYGFLDNELTMCNRNT